MKKITLLLSMGLFSVLASAQCEDFEVTINITDPTCHGFSDGNVSLEITGATAPVTIEITDEDDVVLNAGGAGVANTLSGDHFYYVSVVDDAGCTFEGETFLTDPDPLEPVLTIVDESAPGACDGSITIDTVYGVCGESYGCFFSGPEPGEDCTYEGLCEGDYTITINDECGCSVVADATIDGFSGIEEDEESKITVLPGANGVLTVTGELDNARIFIYDITGKEVYQNNLNTGVNELNLSINSGIYIYSILQTDKLIQKGEFAY